MAVDTANKRRAAPCHPCATVYPVADGFIQLPDRRHAAWLYPGVTPHVRARTRARRVELHADARHELHRDRRESQHRDYRED